MRRAVIALLLVAALTSRAYGKVMVLRGQAPSTVLLADGAVSGSATSERTFRIVQRALGFEYDVWNAAVPDSVEAHFTDYSMVICLNLPDFAAAFDTDAEILANGWGRLGQWLDHDHANACPVPVFVPIPDVLASTNVWAGANTGRTGQRDWANEVASRYKDIESACGDSIYLAVELRSHSSNRVATSDSLAWCHPLIYLQDHLTTVNQRYSPMWMTSAAGSAPTGHKVVWLAHGGGDVNANYMSEFWITAIAMFEPNITPVELCFVVDLFGTNDHSTLQDTTSMAYNLDHQILPYVVANDMKLEFAVCGYPARDFAPVQTALATIEADPEHFRATMASYNISGTSTDPFGHYANKTEAEMVTDIGAMIDTFQTSLDWIDTTRVCGSVYGATASSYNHAAVRGAIASSALTDLYCDGNAYFGSTWPTQNRSRRLNKAERTWWNGKEIRTHEISREMKYRLAATAENDSLRFQMFSTGGGNVSYVGESLARKDVAGYIRAQWSSDFIGILIGQEWSMLSGTMASIYYGGTAMTKDHYKASLMGRFHPAMWIYSTAITGGSPDVAGFPADADPTNSVLLWVLTEVNRHKTMSDNLIQTYGTSGLTSAYKYSWLTDIKQVREYGRRGQWPNSHVKME